MYSRGRSLREYIQLHEEFNPYTLETHGTGDLYHNTITNAVSYDKR